VVVDVEIWFEKVQLEELLAELLPTEAASSFTEPAMSLNAMPDELICLKMTISEHFQRN
jgi:hypothetical protein